LPSQSEKKYKALDSDREIKRSTHVASNFPNTASCLRLASALLAERDEDWMTAKIKIKGSVRHL
jgi:transposase-like protein